MTPERWRQIGELFDAAVRIDPAGREAWLRAACGGDDELRAEVGRLLAQDERADRDGFLTPPEATGPPPDRTASWPPRVDVRPRSEPGPIDRVGDASADDTGGFTPRAAIAPQAGRHPISEPRSVVRARLRELPMIYILILAIVDLLEARRPRAGRPDALSRRRGRSSWPSWASSPCSGAGGPSRWPGSRPWSWG